MRIVYWTHLFYPYIGGMEVSAVRILPQLAKQGFEITVLCCDWDGEIEQDSTIFGMRVLRVPMLRALASRRLVEMKQAKDQVVKLQKKFRPHINHCNLGTPAMMFFHDIKSRTPTILTLHESLIAVRGLSGGKDSLLDKSFKSAAWITGVSHSALNDALSVFPEIGEKSSVIYHGIETASTAPSPVSSDPPKLLVLSRLVEGKGVDHAIEAFARVHNRFPQSRLIIAGEGPQKAMLEQKVTQHDLSNSVEFLGWVAPEEVAGLIDACTIVVIPSAIDEGFGQVAIEAANAGRATVATKAGGLMEAVADGESGILVEKGNPDQLADAVIKLLENKELLNKLSHQAKVRCDTTFSVERSVNEYAKLYQQMAAKTSSGV